MGVADIPCSPPKVSGLRLLQQTAVLTSKMEIIKKNKSLKISKDRLGTRADLKLMGTMTMSLIWHPFILDLALSIFRWHEKQDYKIITRSYKGLIF